jgi:hypothetical protein
MKENKMIAFNGNSSSITAPAMIHNEPSKRADNGQSTTLAFLQTSTDFPSNSS